MVPLQKVLYFLVLPFLDSLKQLNLFLFVVLFQFLWHLSLNHVATSLLVRVYGDISFQLEVVEAIEDGEFLAKSQPLLLFLDLKYGFALF